MSNIIIFFSIVYSRYTIVNFGKEYVAFELLSAQPLFERPAPLSVPLQLAAPSFVPLQPAAPPRHLQPAPPFASLQLAPRRHLQVSRGRYHICSSTQAGAPSRGWRGTPLNTGAPLYYPSPLAAATKRLLASFKRGSYKDIIRRVRMDAKSISCFTSLILFCISLKLLLSTAAESISPGQSLSGNKTIVSQGGIFELGFFTPGDAIRN
ncbi:hypothetical protein MRB53_020932 [Persea americana]|uniref:Uncharacterized protein n=1 Tax=Persea americana TaxID=3435 RepID=A0ACC2L2S4_PERAE|nr:hypothetical protein MRB53_020932 [Persea americana]